ncbi:MAG: hypothetical protein DME92_04915 [Verrucomicrobia bacterium]|nr:MAG: hypothetical protein DME92_04915 [Verrucomicrobiota bacterium]
MKSRSLRSRQKQAAATRRTRTEAEERIATAKEELAHLLSLFPELQREILGLRLAFYFCYDTGKAGVVCATEEDGRFTYHD